MGINVDGTNNVGGTNNILGTGGVQKSGFLNTVFGNSPKSVIPKGNPLTEENLAYLMPMARLSDEKLFDEQCL